MRVIKFRAWHNGGKKPDAACMLYAGDMYGTKHSLDCCKYAMDGQPVTLMQFTGLHDKHGAEIYEGDVVQDHVGVGVVKYSDKNAGFRVSYSDGRAKWFYDYTLSGEGRSIEVIGNIYENPELIV